jgi:translation initiation factor RLI1
MHQLKLNDPHFLPQYGCELELFLEEGRPTILVGDNGVGKSTLVRRFYEANAERISLIDQQSLDYFYDRKVGMIKEVLLSSRGEEIDLSLFTECWKRFGLEKKENRFQSQLSGGEGQALKICLGLALDRPIYILDEPSQYLDQSFRQQLDEILRGRLLKRKSLLIVEHDLKWMGFNASMVSLEVRGDVLKVGKTWTM